MKWITIVDRNKKTWRLNIDKIMAIKEEYYVDKVHEIKIYYEGNQWIELHLDEAEMNLVVRILFA